MTPLHGYVIDIAYQTMDCILLDICRLFQGLKIVFDNFKFTKNNLIVAPASQNNFNPFSNAHLQHKKKRALLKSSLFTLN